MISLRVSITRQSVIVYCVLSFKKVKSTLKGKFWSKNDYLVIILKIATLGDNL